MLKSIILLKTKEECNDEVYKYCIKYDKEGFFSRIFPKFVPVYKLLEDDYKIFMRKEDCKS